MKQSTLVLLTSASLVGLLGGCAVDSSPGETTGNVSDALQAPTVLVTFDGSIGELPEGIVVPASGPNANKIFVSIAPYASIVTVANRTATPFATLADPTDRLGLGMAADDNGAIYWAICYGGPGGTAPAGIYKVPSAGGTARLLTPAGFAASCANGIDIVGDRAYWTDSDLSAVNVTNLRTGATRVWSTSPLIYSNGTACGITLPFANGANGITHIGNTIYVSNTDYGRIVAIDIRRDGTAGTGRVVAESCSRLNGVDGIMADADGSIIGARQANSSIVRILLNGAVIPVFTGAPLDGPASPFIVRSGGKARVLVTNSTFGSPPGGPGPSVVSVPLN